MTQFKAEKEEIKNKFRAEGNNLEIEFHKKKEAIKNEKEEAIRKKQEAIRKQEEALQKKQEALQQKEGALQQKEDALQQKEDALQKKEEDFEIDYNIKKKELQQRKENEEDELYTKIFKKIDEWENEIK